MRAVWLGLSAAECLGFKGPQATPFAATLGRLPEPNQWVALADGSRLLRLGHNEYLLDAADAEALAPWRERLAAAPAGVVGVLHQDTAIDLRGPAVRALLRQTCALDLAVPGAPSHAVTMTQVIGVAVVAITHEQGVRLLFDPSWAHYMAHELQAIAAELNAADNTGDDHDPR
jgi:heterotetrameric sarcosine oxidase gamma subunit